MSKAHLQAIALSDRKLREKKVVGLLRITSILLFIISSDTVSLSHLSNANTRQSAHTRKFFITKSNLNALIAIEEVQYLDEDEWWKLLEVHVRNISGKPIYFLEVDVDCPEVVNTEIDGAPRTLVLPLTYGRRELLKPGNRANSDDNPLPPGERCVLKIQSKYLESSAKLAGVTRVFIRAYSLSFGDETGFTAGGVALPKK